MVACFCCQIWIAVRHGKVAVMASPTPHILPFICSLSDEDDHDRRLLPRRCPSPLGLKTGPVSGRRFMLHVHICPSWGTHFAPCKEGLPSIKQTQNRANKVLPRDPSDSAFVADSADFRGICRRRHVCSLLRCVLMRSRQISIWNRHGPDEPHYQFPRLARASSTFGCV